MTTPPLYLDVIPGRTPNGRPMIGIPGEAAMRLVHRAYRHVGPTARPDCALAERDHRDWNLLGASTRGVQHSLSGEPRQDNFGLIEVGETVYCVVCDGVGQFQRSHEAADLAVGAILDCLDRGLDVDAAIDSANAALCGLVDDGNGVRATTLLVAAVRLADPGWLTVDLWRVGDPYAWALLEGVWTQLTPPSTSSAYFSTASRALPDQDPVIDKLAVSLRCDGVFFMTDGVGQPMEAVDEVRETLAAWWTVKPTIFDFASQVSFVRQSHMDDRTVVGLWPTRAEEPAAEANLEPEPADCPESEED